MKEAPEGVGGAEAPTQDEAAEGRGPSLRTPSAQVYATHVLFTNRQGNIPTFKITGHIQLISLLRVLSTFPSGHCSNRKEVRLNNK